MAADNVRFHGPYDRIKLIGLSDLDLAVLTDPNVNRDSLTALAWRTIDTVMTNNEFGESYNSHASK